MTAPLIAATIAPMTASASASSSSASSSEGSGGMDSLFAAFMNMLGASEDGSGQTAEALAEDGLVTTDGTTLDLDTLIGLFTPTTEGEATSETDTSALLDKLNALLADLKELASQLSEQTDPDTDQLQALAGLVDIMTQAVNVASASTDGDLSGLETLRQNLNALAEGKLPSLPASGQTGTQTSGANQQAQANTADDGQNLLNQLQSMDGIETGDALDAINAQLQKLGDKLSQLTTQTQTASASATTTTTAQASTATDQLAALLGATTQQQTVNGAKKSGDLTQSLNPLDEIAPSSTTTDDTTTSLADKKPATSGVNTKQPSLAENLAASANAAPSATQNAQTSDAKADPVLLAQVSAQSTSTNTTNLALGTTPYQVPTPQINTQQLGYEIAYQAKAGNSSFEIRLDPPEMGKIDVKLDLDSSGNVHARLSVERSETLDLLQRDARALERALNQAGLDASKTNLEFSLKQNPFAGQQGQDNGQPQFQASNDGFTGSSVIDTTASDTDVSSVPLYYRGYASPGGVNVLA